MRNLVLFIVVLTSVMTITSCEKDDEINQLSLLRKSWTHSYEEKALEGVQIYRPSDYKDFQSSWYRQIFNFEDNNECDYYVLAPNDAHFMASGSWDYNDKINIIKVFNSDSEMIYEFEVVVLTDDLLKLKTKR